MARDGGPHADDRPGVVAASRCSLEGVGLKGVATVAGGLLLVPVSRSAFDEERAACGLCGSHVMLVGEMTQMLVRRLVGPGATAGECSVCQRVTYFALS